MQDKKTIEDNNKLIAEFMGATVTQDYLGNNGYMVYYPKESSPDIQRYHSSASIKYHSSWDWLMPVVEHISKTISNEVANKYFWGKDDINDFRIFRVETIADLHGQISDFINWYNKQEK